jgi:hypothetical protein
MSDANRDALKSMLNNLINDKPEEATLDFHNYVTGKMKSVAGIGGTEEVVDDVSVGDVVDDADDQTPPDELE